MRIPSVESGNLRALILKADHFAAEGDDRAASSFYLAALKAAPPPEQLPAELRRELGRAQAMCARYAAQFEAFLKERLARHPGGGKPGSRFAQSLEILFGKKQVYFQQPRNYFFPELPQIQFYERSLFPWLDTVEAATADIRAELLEVLKDKSAFRPYVEADARRPQGDEGGMLGNLDWSAFYLVKNGETVTENAARCPRTLAALARAPLSHIPNRSPSVLFSLLRPGAHIPPHNGFVNTRLICHLPLIVPGKCEFRVGNEIREWVEGKALVFDDTMEHEAWNRSGETRVVLLFDVWRPELTDEERALVSAMFEAIDTHTGQTTAWET